MAWAKTARVNEVSSIQCGLGILNKIIRSFAALFL